MNTDDAAEVAGQATVAAAKPPSRFSVRLLFVVTTLFMCLLGIVTKFQLFLGRGIWVGVVVLPAVVLPPYCVLRPDRRPWRFSIRSLLVLTTVYAILLSAAATSFTTFLLGLYHLEIVWIACFYPFVMFKRGWYGCLLALLGVVGIVAPLAFLLLLLWGSAMSGWGPHPEPVSPTWGAAAVIGIVVSTVVMCCGVFWQIARRRKDWRSDRGK